MKNLLKALFSAILVSSTVLPIIACKSNKANENKNESDSSYNEISQDLKDFIVDFLSGTKSSLEGRHENDFSILSTKELGISSLSEFAHMVEN